MTTTESRLSMKPGLFLVLLALAAAAAGAAEPPRPWQHVGGVGARQFVLVTPAMADDAQALAGAAETLCPGGKPCVVVFWSDPARVPTAMPMSSAQRRAIVAEYVRNPATGSAELVRRCRGGEGRGVKCLR